MKTAEFHNISVTQKEIERIFCGEVLCTLAIFNVGIQHNESVLCYRSQKGLEIKTSLITIKAKWPEKASKSEIFGPTN